MTDSSHRALPARDPAPPEAFGPKYFPPGLVLILLPLAALCASGCSSVRMTPAGRSAADQYLVARSVEDTVSRLDLGPTVEGKRVGLELHAITADEGMRHDLDYLESTLRSALAAAGATEPAGEEPADLTLHVHVQAVGSDTRQGGIQLPIVLPSLATGLTTTKISIYTNNRQTARCHLHAYALDPEGAVVLTRSPIYVSHYMTERDLLGFSLGSSTDLRELKRRDPTPGE